MSETSHDQGFCSYFQYDSDISAEIIEKICSLEYIGFSIYSLALIVGAIFIILEIVVGLSKKTMTRNRFLDMLASMSTQIPFGFTEVFVFLFSISAYLSIYYYFVVPMGYALPINGWTLLLGILAADFAYYWEHRLSHQIRLFWTAHAVHHSSPHYNTAVAFRFSPFDAFLSVLFHLPLVLAGFNPVIVVFGEVVVQAYQFWIHTETIGKLGWIDKVLNTPSNHRVHHGSNQKYIDKNYGGILIIFDRIFGTFKAEEETPKYGLTKQINTVNPLKVWFSEFPGLFRDWRNSRSFSEAWGYTFRAPGWKPPKQETPN